MIYNFNLGIGWASSGVEYAQSYRAKMLRRIGAEAKFVFTDMFPTENIEHMTKNIGFLDSEVLWLYSGFSDFKTAPVSWTLGDVYATIPYPNCSCTRNGKTGRIQIPDRNSYYTVYFVDEASEKVHRVEIVSNGCLVRKEYYTYGKLYAEYYAPLNGKAHMYLRQFFNEDGSLAYAEIIDDEKVMYQFPDRFLYSKEELVAYFTQRLKLTGEDTVIIDRTTGIGQAILRNVGEARVGIVIHADHFSEGNTDEENILWNNYYEYSFGMNRHIDFYIASTEDQSKLVRSQFQKYLGVTPCVYTIPVGGLSELKRPAEGRKPYSLITASRLASEKHLDWVVEAVIKAKAKLPQLSLDIYGEGSEKAKLNEIIHENKAEEYIHLCGQHDLTEIYQRYEAYIAGSMSEGFGLTLMEAIGAGLPIIGFDVRYGNPTFIDDGKNGYLIAVNEKMTVSEKTAELEKCILRLFSEADLTSFHAHSYQKAERYLTEEVEKCWKEMLQ